MVNKMKTKFLIIVGAIISLGMNSVASYAEDVQSPSPRGEIVFAKEIMFAKFDANGDGKVSYDEYMVAKDKFHQKMQSNHMKLLDVDKDSTISPSEFSHWREQMQHKNGSKKGGYGYGKFTGNHEERFERCDYNKDGKIEKSEMQQSFNEKVDKIFAEKDKNNDGVITKDEILPKTPDQRFAEHDINGDGKIDKTEMDKFRNEKSKRHFEMKDQNGDGYLDQSEFGKRKWKGGGSHRGNMK